MKARSHPYRHGAGALALVAAGSLVLAACGSSHNTSSTTTTAGQHHHHATTLSSCAPALVQIKPTFGGAAAGGSYYRFEVTNTSPRSCTLSGFPALTFFAPGAAGGAGTGSQLQITATDSGPSVTTVTLAKGESAEFLLLYTDVPVNGGGCQSVASVNVRLPKDSSLIPVPVTFSPCGGVVKVYALSTPGTESP